MSVEERMLEEELRRFAEQRFRIAAMLGQSSAGAERVADGFRWFVVHHRSIGKLLQPVRDPVDQIVTGRPKRGRAHVERRVSTCDLDVLCRHHRNPSKISDSRLRPPLTRLNAR